MEECESLHILLFIARLCSHTTYSAQAQEASNMLVSRRMLQVLLATSPRRKHTLSPASIRSHHVQSDLLTFRVVPGQSVSSLPLFFVKLLNWVRNGMLNGWRRSPSMEELSCLEPPTEVGVQAGPNTSRSKDSCSDIWSGGGGGGQGNSSCSLFIFGIVHPKSSDRGFPLD